jgi:hypothetical protein
MSGGSFTQAVKRLDTSPARWRLLNQGAFHENP